jgi:hypothetical protein
MAVIQLSNGGVYNFITQGGSTAHIASVGGTDYPFQTYFMQGIITSGSSTSTINSLTVNNILLHQGLKQYKSPIDGGIYGPVPIDTDTISVTNLQINGYPKLVQSGSMYSFYGNTDHSVRLASPSQAKYGTIVRFMKLTNTTNTLAITGSGGLINSSSSIACSDPYATIELISADDPVASGGRWVILSKTGAWS